MTSTTAEPADNGRRDQPDLTQPDQADSEADILAMDPREPLDATIGSLVDDMQEELGGPA